jgi:hypothetical protein
MTKCKNKKQAGANKGGGDEEEVEEKIGRGLRGERKWSLCSDQQWTA